MLPSLKHARAAPRHGTRRGGGSDRSEARYCGCNPNMQLTVNGKREEHDNIATVADLLRHFDVAPIRVAVELNQQLVPRADFGRTALQDGDAVEIVTFVGGG